VLSELSRIATGRPVSALCPESRVHNPRAGWYTKSVVIRRPEEVDMSPINISMSRKNALLSALAGVLVLGLTSSGAALASGAPPAAAPRSVTTSARTAAAAAAIPAMPVTGTLRDANNRVVGTVTGQVTRFAVRGGKLVAGTNLTGRTGSASETQRFLLPVADATNPTAISGVVNCQILNLVLGPLDLNLLGLRVQLNRVLLNITAVACSGNLLGNLLCAVAHLLDGPGFLANVAALLNQILDIINKIRNP
jgi:hypothetical protein